MITAKEAREKSGPTIEEMAEFFEPHIIEAANKKIRTVTVYHGQLENEAYGHTETWRSFCKYMEELGYKAEFHYEERQFVDMRIKISW